MDKRLFDVNGITFNMLPVEGGRFVMGATSEQHADAFDNEAPAHSVKLDDYYLGESVVTQSLWNAVMNEVDEEGSEMPVTGKSWAECQSFIQKLNDLTGRVFRMPTEAEWEYAARGGKKTRGCKYAGSNVLDDVAWYEKNSGRTMHPVKQKRPNELGFYDMSGNVWEWCADWYGAYETNEDEEGEALQNPQGPKRGSQRVVRGAGKAYYARSCRVSCRLPLEPSGGNYDGTGLRLAMDVVEQPKETDVSGTDSAIGATPNVKTMPRGTASDNNKRTGQGQKRNTDGQGNYWRPTGGAKRKKKIWPWIVAACALLLVLLLVTSRGGGGASDHASPVEEPQAIQEDIIPSPESINQEVWQYFNTADSLFANNQLVLNVDKDYTSKIKELSNGWNYLLKAEEKNNDLRTLDSITYKSNEKEIKELKNGYKDHFQVVYKKECEGLMKTYKEGDYPKSYQTYIDDYIKRIKQLKEFSGFDIIKSDSISVIAERIIENTK